MKRRDRGLLGRQLAIVLSRDERAGGIAGERRREGERRIQPGKRAQVVPALRAGVEVRAGRGARGEADLAIREGRQGFERKVLDLPHSVE